MEQKYSGGGSKISTGEFTTSGPTNKIIIEHDLGAIPTTFIFMPKNHNVVFPYWSLIGYTGVNFLYWAGSAIRYEDYYYDHKIANITKTESTITIECDYYELTIPQATFQWVAIA